MGSEKGQKKIFMTNKINYFAIIITLEGIEKTKTEKKKRKMTTKQSETDAVTKQPKTQ